jgi:hypothetical protein
LNLVQAGFVAGQEAAAFEAQLPSGSLDHESSGALMSPYRVRTQLHWFSIIALSSTNSYMLIDCILSFGLLPSLSRHVIYSALFIHALRNEISHGLAVFATRILFAGLILECVLMCWSQPVSDINNPCMNFLKEYLHTNPCTKQ